MSKERLKMQAAISQHYHAYTINPHYVPSNRMSLFHRSQETLMELKRDAMASWLSLVVEVVLTQQHIQSTNNNKITQYFARKVSSNDVRVEATILQAPFSMAYYRRTNPAPSKHSTKKSNAQPAKPRRRPRNSQPTPAFQDGASTLRPHANTLQQYGFHNRTNQHTISRLSRRQADQSAEKTEYSGTFLSTAYNVY
jgi:hypothetical protein